MNVAGFYEWKPNDIIIICGVVDIQISWTKYSFVRSRLLAWLASEYFIVNKWNNWFLMQGYMQYWTILLCRFNWIEKVKWVALQHIIYIAFFVGCSYDFLIIGQCKCCIADVDEGFFVVEKRSECGVEFDWLVFGVHWIPLVCVELLIYPSHISSRNRSDCCEKCRSPSASWGLFSTFFIVFVIFRSLWLLFQLLKKIS